MRVWVKNGFFVLMLSMAVSAFWQKISQYQMQDIAKVMAATAQANADKNSASHLEQWLKQRRKTAGIIRDGGDAIQAARAQVEKTAIKIPRDAAVCIEARRKADEDLSAAMRPGRDFAADLKSYHDKKMSIDIFCDYALTIGGRL